MTSKPRLYIHIGHPKAGSSTIQHFLHDNQDMLVEHGFLMPERDFVFKKSGDFCWPPIDFLSQAFTDKDGALAVRKGVEKGVEALSRISGKGLILSAENLARPAGAAHLFQSLSDLVDIHVIYYIRRRDEFLLSSWKQWASKTGISLYAFIENRVKNPQGFYKHIIMDWEKNCSLSSLTVRPLHRSVLKDGDISCDFASWLGVAFDKMRKTHSHNISYSHDVSVLLSGTPELFTSIHDNTLTDYLLEYAPDIMGRREGEILGYERRQKIYDAYFDDHDYVHKRFFPESDFETLFGISHIDKAEKGYEPRPFRLIHKSFGLLLKLVFRQHKRIRRLEHKLERLDHLLGRDKE